MATLDQHRAALAFKHVDAFRNKEKPHRKKYATMVHKLPALVTAAGLCQALHFIQSRGNDDQKKLLEHLAEQLRRVDPAIRDADSLLDRVRNAELSSYLRLTHEATLCASWYRRMVQGVLKIDAAAAEEGE